MIKGKVCVEVPSVELLENCSDAVSSAI